ncbi:MAG: polysaccharide deacetylase family protein [Vicinamibacterales bacterium]
MPPSHVHAEQGGLILMYHRIAPIDSDPWMLAVTPEHFAAHLEVLRRTTSPVPLRRFVADHLEGAVGARTVAVTFDDGYADNLHAASPLLVKHDIPATVYVATGFTGTTCEFWWDCLERAILPPRQLPSTLTLTLGGQERRWRLSAVNALSRIGIRRSRIRFLFNVREHLLPLSNADRDEAVRYLLDWSGSTVPPRANRRVMTADELRQMDAGGLMELGAHTVSHPQLPSLPADAQLEEMARSRADLEGILGHPVWSFSYPYGAADETTIALARSLGFESATAVHEETVWRESDVFRLPRFAVRDWDGAEFERRLNEWFRQRVAPET